MGVDASYLYGYGADVSEIEWDIDYLKEKYKDKLNKKARENQYSMTYSEIINDLEMHNNNEDADLDSIGDELGFKYSWVEGDGAFLTFNHKHIVNMLPNTKLTELDDAAKLYAKEIGIKNIDDIEWIEFGYFS